LNLFPTHSIRIQEITRRSSAGGQFKGGEKCVYSPDWAIPM